MSNLPIILVVDDEHSVLSSLEAILEGKFKVLTAKSGEEALRIITEEIVNLVFLDIKMSDMDGMEVLRKIKEHDENLAVVMVTAIDSVKVAVEAMRLGACNYITKPFDADELIVMAEREIERERLLKEVVYLRSQRKEVKFDNIIGSHKKMKEVYTIVEKVNKNDVTIFITGESGTGKELIARAIHFNGPRKDRPFIAINCASIPENLLESELFGHEKGAFTDAVNQKLGMIELASSGTLFLDEISELRLGMQAKLLRALEEREIKRLGGTKIIKVDLRIISATNTDLKKAVPEGRFRADLYYRLNVVPIHIPALRERKTDIPLLIEYFLNMYNQAFRKNIEAITAEALGYLKHYDWPGNVRELKNVIERIVALKDSGFITDIDLPFDILIQKNFMNGIETKSALKDASNNFQRQYIEMVLKKVNGNQVKASQILGIHRNALLNKIKSLGIKR